ncbi:hypothetical protein HYW17_00415 [Candidatus Uhrbacteria bacterium]|nr:hypothetical protein [Candidatus Uhrbacteria bacterium]
MKPIENLKNLGLPEQEANIYLALLKLGGSQASKVAKEAGLKRTTVYPILKSLAQKGFCNVYFRKNRRFYYAEKPHKVARLFAKKLEIFESVIPMLESVEKKQTQQFGLRFIEALDELKQFYTEILDEYQNKSYYVISSGQEWEGLDPQWFVEFRKERGRRNIRTKLILSPQFKDKNPTDPKFLRTWKYVPEKYAFKSTIDIFKDKVLIISPQLSSLAIVVAVPTMVDVFQSAFNIIWDLLPAEKI